MAFWQFCGAKADDTFRSWINLYPIPTLANRHRFLVAYYVNTCIILILQCQFLISDKTVQLLLINILFYFTNVFTLVYRLLFYFSHCKVASFNFFSKIKNMMMMIANESRHQKSEPKRKLSPSHFTSVVNNNFLVLSILLNSPS